MDRYNQGTMTAPAASRTILWAIVSLTVCPAVGLAMLYLSGSLWDQIVPLASKATIFLFATFGEISHGRGAVSQSLAVIFAAALAALGPAIALGLAKSTWSARGIAMASLFPALLLVMCAPAAVIYEYASVLNADVFGARLSTNFLGFFSAIATAAALAYTFWVHIVRNDAEI